MCGSIQGVPIAVTADLISPAIRARLGDVSHGSLEQRYTYSHNSRSMPPSSSSDTDALHILLDAILAWPRVLTFLIILSAALTA